MTQKRHHALFAILILLVCHQSHSNRFKDYARIKPISWAELQTKKINIDTRDNVNLSEQCPTDVISYNGKPNKLKYSYIYFKNYYWSEYTDKSGKLCIIKYEDSLRTNISGVVLTRSQAEQLLKAAEVYGFDENSKGVFNAHLNLHRIAVRAPESLKYGYILHISKFIKENEPEKPITNGSRFEISKEGFAIIHTISPVELLEQLYSKETLNNLIQQVKTTPPNKISTGIYPFKTVDAMIFRAKQDVKNGLEAYMDVYHDF